MDIRFAPTVSIGGVDAKGVTLAGARITYGRLFPGQTPAPSTAFLTLLPLDVRADLPDGYPGLGFGSAIQSGFTENYEAEYEAAGGSLLAMGTPVVIGVRATGGFTEAYDDVYGGYEAVRFTGSIVAIDYQPEAISLTLLTTAEQLTRKMLLPAAWPSETEVARVQRIAADAGVTVTIEGANTAVLSSYPEGETYVSAWQLLAQVAEDCNAVLYTNRTGAVIYRTRAADTGRSVVDLAPMATLTDTLTMVQELGQVVNSFTVTYPGDPDDVSFTVEDADSIQRFGKRAAEASVQLVQASAEAYAQRFLDLYSEPFWAMPTAQVVIHLAESYGDYPANIAQLLEVDLDDEVLLPAMLPNSPLPAYTSRVTGYTETLDPVDWSLTFALDPHGWTWKQPGDAPPPPPVVGPSMHPALRYDGTRGQFRIVNYDGNLTYVATNVRGGGTAELDIGSGVYTVSSGDSLWSVTTTEDGSRPAQMERKQFTYHQEDRGYWTTQVVEVDQSYPARAVLVDHTGEPAVDYGNGWACPPGWWVGPIPGPGIPPRCQTLIVEWKCDNGGTSDGNGTCVKRVLTEQPVWVSSIQTVRDGTPAGFTDTGDEWVRVA